MTVERLRHLVPPPLVNWLWQRARSGQYGSTRKYPACSRRMAEVPIIIGGGKTTYLDVCTGCHVVWFDALEFEGLPKIPVRSAEDEALPQKMKEARALAQIFGVFWISSGFTHVAVFAHLGRAAVGVLFCR